MRTPARSRNQRSARIDDPSPRLYPRDYEHVAAGLAVVRSLLMIGPATGKTILTRASPPTLLPLSARTQLWNQDMEPARRCPLAHEKLPAY